MFLPLSDIPNVKASFKFISSLNSGPEANDSDPVSISERSGINQPFAIGLERAGPELAVREHPLLDQRMVPHSESGAYEAVEYESA